MGIGRIARIWHRLSTLILAAALAACGGGGSDGGAAQTAPSATDADVAVTVIDTDGRFVDGAVLTTLSTGATATTDAGGKATLKVPAGSEQAITAAKTGFAEQVRLLTLDAAATQGSLRAMLVARQPAVSIGAIESGGSASGRHGVKVEFPPGALVDPDGNVVSGAVDVFMTPLDISTSDVEAFPGVFEGIAAGTPRGPIVSLGTAELVPMQGGRKLQLLAGKTATVELPLYATTLLDGTTIHLGDTIPLWSLGSSSGLWTQEGSGTVVASAASPTGLALRAPVGHFSWWNGDQLATRASIVVTVTAPGTTVPAGTRATVAASVVSGLGPASTATTEVVVGVASTVTVPAPTTMRLDAGFDVGSLRCSGSTTAAVATGATVAATISVVCIEVPTPNIVVPAALSSTNSRAPTRVQIVVDGPVPDGVELLADGAVVATFAPQHFYVHLLDTTSLPEGTVTLSARATLGGIARSGNSVQLVVDRTPPQATEIAPGPTTLVGRDTTFTVVFDEPVNALPFTLDDAVTLSVTPAGAITPTAVAADVALDAAGTTLTVRPRADLPAGTASVGWGGLRDAAGNAVTGTLAASWDVDRSTAIGPALSHFSFKNDYIGAALAIRADGSLLAAHKPAPGDVVVLSRYDSASDAWSVLAPAVNERPTQNLLQLAVGSDDVPYVAFVQQTAANAGAWELVLKRWTGTALELAAPAVPLAGARGIDVNQGSMTIDALNRPVIAFTDPNSNVRVFRLEAGALVPLATVATLAADPHLALAADGTPFVAYLQAFGGSNAAVLRVASVAGGIVQPVGGDVDSVPNATQGIGQPRIVMRGTEPWLFWDKFDGSVRRVRAARFDGTNWIDQPLPVPFDGSELDAAVLDGDPILAASGGNHQIVVFRFRAGAWEDPFDATTRTGDADRMQLVVRGASVAMISSNINNGNVAEVQRLRFP